MRYNWYKICSCNPTDAFLADNYHNNELNTKDFNYELEYITHSGLKDALYMFENDITIETNNDAFCRKTFKFIEIRDYYRLVYDILIEIRENRDPVLWCRANVTQMLGDICLLFIQMEIDGFVKHECTDLHRWDCLFITQNGQDWFDNVEW